MCLHTAASSHPDTSCAQAEYKHITITSTSAKRSERRGQIKHPLDPGPGSDLMAKHMTCPRRREVLTEGDI